MTNLIDKLPTSEKRNVNVSLETAKRWKELGGEFEKIALETFPELNVRNEWDGKFILKEIRDYCSTSLDLINRIKCKTSCSGNTVRQLRSALAYVKLKNLMALPEYNGDWVPDWNSDSVKNVIHRRGIGLCCDFNYDIYIYQPIAFKSVAVCKKFFYNNLDLLKEYFEL